MSEVTAGGQMCEETGSEPVDQGQGRGIGYPLQRESSLARPQESAGELRLRGGQMRPHSRLSKPGSGSAEQARRLDVQWAAWQPAQLSAGLPHGQSHWSGLLCCKVTADQPDGGW